MVDADETEIRQLVRVWYNRARWVGSEDDVLFVFLWISFNAWLAFESDEDRDSRMIGWLKSDRSDGSQLKASYDVALGSDVFRGYLKVLAAHPIPHSLREQPDIVIAGVEDFPHVVEAIYLIRCGLFHGKRTANVPDDVKSVIACARILRKWIGNLVNDWEQ